MTTPQIATIRRSGSRWYVDPRDGSKNVGVTSVLRMQAKPFLQYWAAKVVAEEAVDSIGAVMNLITAGNRDAAVDMLKRAPGRSSGAAADTGTAVHGIVERINRGEDPGLIHPDHRPWIDQYERFLDEWQPTFLEVEATCWSEDPAYAGTMDGIALIDGETLLFDLKTGRGVYEEVSLQLSAYAAASYILEPDGSQRPIPELDGACVLHLRPDSADLIPIRIGPDIFEVFVALMRVLRWDTEEKRGVIGAPQSQRKK